MNTTVYLIRHGEAAGSWDNTLDPGLSPLGQQQAERAAAEVATAMAPVDIFCSPLKRTQETAMPLSRRWEQEVRITPELREVPSDGVDFAKRRQWLDSVLEGKWPDQAAELHAWRENILRFTRERDRDAVFVTHFVVINAIVGAIQQSERMIVFRPDHCSVTKIHIENGELRLGELGSEAITTVR